MTEDELKEQQTRVSRGSEILLKISRLRSQREHINKSHSFAIENKPSSECLLVQGMGIGTKSDGIRIDICPALPVRCFEVVREMIIREINDQIDVLKKEFAEL